MKIKVLIVDDEPYARKRIRDLLKDEENVEIIGESESGPEAVNDIPDKKPDIVFLDIQMPGFDGFEVIEKIGIDKMPYIIFVTAFDKYAIHAFEVNALDYLLKPYTKVRFRKALSKAVDQINSKATDELHTSLENLIRNIKNNEKFSDRLVIKYAGRYDFIKINEIEWIESAGNYVTIHTKKDNFIMRSTMNSIEETLDPSKFIRIHRQTIVNVNEIKKIQHIYGGEYNVTLYNGTKLTLGIKYKEKLDAVIKEKSQNFSIQ